MKGPVGMVSLWVWYRGAGFHGYQQQQGQRTVQGELLRAFAEAGLSRKPVVAGRTDKGVSARMQVLSARLELQFDPERLKERLTPLLPDDLGVVTSHRVPHGFHAAWSASSKEYRYALPVDAAGEKSRLREAIELIPGTRSFSVFHFKSSVDKPRTVTSVELLEEAGELTLRFVGEGFARYMVRMLVGGATAVARGEVPIDVFRSGLEKQTKFHCPTAPAEPLTLWNVGYPPEVDPFSAEERRLFDWGAHARAP